MGTRRVSSQERKGTQQIYVWTYVCVYIIYLITFACAILMNIHLYLFDCARSTNTDQFWCLIEKKKIGRCSIKKEEEEDKRCSMVLNRANRFGPNIDVRRVIENWSCLSLRGEASRQGRSSEDDFHRRGVKYLCLVFDNQSINQSAQTSMYEEMKKNQSTLNEWEHWSDDVSRRNSSCSVNRDYHHRNIDISWFSSMTTNRRKEEETFFI